MIKKRLISEKKNRQIRFDKDVHFCFCISVSLYAKKVAMSKIRISFRVKAVYNILETVQIIRKLL